MINLMKETDEKDHALLLMHQLSNMREIHQHCDFVIKIDNYEIPAHRNILAAASDYFKAMLSHQTSEARSGYANLKQCHPESVKICIDFIYSGKACVSENNIPQLMHIAHMMQLSKLCEAISNYAMENLQSKIFFTLKRMANMYNCFELEKKCDMFALKHFKKISEMSDFNFFDIEYVLFLIASDLCKASETFKCHAIVEWTKFDGENRWKSFPSLLGNINLPLVDSAYLKYLLTNEPLFSEIFLRDHSLTFLKQFEEVSSKSFEELDMIFDELIVFDRFSKHLQSYGPNDNNNWKIMQSFSDEAFTLTQFSTVCLNDDIYVLAPGKAMYRLHISDKKGTWNRLQDMINDHGERPPVTTCSGSIYVVGNGYPRPTKWVEKYDPCKDKWTKVGDKLIFCRNSTSVTVKGFIYSIGGLFPANTMCLKEVERYDPSDSQWRFISPMTQARSNPAAVECDEKIYVLGGWQLKPLHSVEFYDVMLNTWTTVKPMIESRYFFSAFVLDDELYAVGGLNKTSSIEKMDSEYNRWEKILIPSEMNLNILGAVKIKLSLGFNEDQESESDL